MCVCGMADGGGGGVPTDMNSVCRLSRNSVPLPWYSPGPGVTDYDMLEKCTAVEKLMAALCRTLSDHKDVAATLINYAVRSAAGDWPAEVALLKMATESAGAALRVQVASATRESLKKRIQKKEELEEAIAEGLWRQGFRSEVPGEYGGPRLEDAVDKKLREELKVADEEVRASQKAYEVVRSAGDTRLVS